MIEMVFIGKDGGIVKNAKDAVRFERTEYEDEKVISISMGELV